MVLKMENGKGFCIRANAGARADSMRATRIVVSKPETLAAHELHQCATSSQTSDILFTQHKALCARSHINWRFRALGIVVVVMLILLVPRNN